jgi:serine/threonine protein kinase
LEGHREFSGQALNAGTQLQNGRYTIVELLGQGGFGITYRAEAAAGGNVAIKEFFPAGCRRDALDVRPATADAIEFDAANEKFFEEARILARFSHPGIVRVHEVFREHNTSYMVMEHLQGQTLQELLNERHVLPEAEAVDYIQRAALALEIVHDAGLLHRDIKPGNIMVCPDERVVLIDFGTARAFQAGQAQQHTVSITPGYAPLEQYARQARRGPYTDLYALAATLYHLLTGEAPVPATDRASGVALPEIRTLNPQISRLSAWTVIEALSMEVAKRPQNARQFIERLQGKEGLTVPESSDPLQQFLETLQSQPKWSPPPKLAPPAPGVLPVAPAEPRPAPPVSSQVLPSLPVTLVQTIKSNLAPRSIALAPNGSWLASASLHEVVLWDIILGKRIQSLRGHWTGINSIAISFDGKMIASGDERGDIRVWYDRGPIGYRDRRTQLQEHIWVARPFEGHTWKVKSVAFSADGTRLASGSSDMSVRFWDVATCETIRAMRVNTQRITTMALSPDASHAVSGGWE